MAKQIAFTAPPLTPKPEFRNRMPAATEKRAEALVAACELLEVAREHEAIDLAQGLIGAKTTLITQVSEFAGKPAAVTALRNLIILAKVLAEVDSQVISNFATEFKAGSAGAASENSPPSLWQLTKNLDHPDVRRGLSFILHTVEALGRAVKPRHDASQLTHAGDNGNA